MIDDTLHRIEEKLAAGQFSPEQRQELIGLVTRLRGELEQLSQKDAEQARSVAGFAEVSSHEATRVESDPALLDLSLQGLQRSVEKVESDQPELVRVVNAICVMLSNSGI